MCSYYLFLQITTSCHFFEIAVELVEDALDAGDGMRDSVVRAQMVQEDASVEMAMLSPHQITDEFELDEILEPSDESGELSALSEQPAHIAALLENNQKQLTDATDDFLRAAGLNPDDFRGIDALALLKNAAKLLAEYTEGTHALLVSKDKIMAGMNVRKAAKTTNPLRSSDGCDNALRLMLGRNNDVNTSGALAIEAAFDELLLHQRAVISAMRNAINETTDEHRQPGPFDDEFVKAYVLETTD
jgi:predicted component of type VI protein secretion system